VKGHPINAAQSSTAGHDAPARAHRSATPQLSIILVSLESRAELERAVRVIAPVVHDLSAQLIIVRRNVEPAIQHVLPSLARMNIIGASGEATRVEMLAMAMRAADGEVIVVRDDTAVVDAEWLAGYRRLRGASSHAAGGDVEVPVRTAQETDTSARTQTPGQS
jgi:hypothetical protein